MLQAAVGNGRSAHMRTSAEPQVRPPPSASISTRSPLRMRPSSQRLGQRQRHRGGRGVGVAIDGDHHPLRRQAELAAHRVDDPQIGLVRHQPVDVALRQPVGGERLVHRLGEPDHRVAEHLAAVHHQMARPVAAARPRHRHTGYRPACPGHAGGWRECRGRCCRCPCRRAGTPHPRRRRTARRCRGPASSGCANRPRCRSPARRAPGRCGSCCRPPTARR